MAKFTPSLYAAHILDRLSKTQLDEALENGYFPNGSKLSTSIAAYFDKNNAVLPRLYLRAPTNPPIFSKSKRKLLRKNSKLFQVEVRNFHTDEEIDRLWVKFKKSTHKWKNTPKLQHHLFVNKSPKNFPARLLTVRDGSRLVAFTVVFEGNRTLASLEAAYDPAYSKFSPGIYTMLLEMEYARISGKEYYYPGFIYKDVPMFQYKLRLGGVEYFNLKSSSWKSIEELKQEDWLFEEMKFKMIQMAGKLSKLPLSTPPVVLLRRINPDTLMAPYSFFIFMPCIRIERKGVFFYLYFQPISEKYILIEENEGLRRAKVTFDDGAQSFSSMDKAAAYIMDKLI